MLKKFLASTLLASIIAFSSISSVIAVQNQGSPDSGNSTNSGSSNSGTSTNNSSVQGSQGNTTQGQGLSSSRKQTCDSRKGNIDKTMAQYSTTVQNRLALFNKIAERIRTYYEANKLSIAQYEQLMSQVNAQQKISTEATNQIRQNTSIDCNSSDPIGNTQQFRTHVQTAQSALQKYRTAIHNLLNAVLTAAENSEV